MQQKKLFQQQQHILKSKFMLSKWVRIVIYSLLFITIITINISNGLFPYSALSIKTDLHINNSMFGMFALANSVGKIIGSFVFIYTINNTNRKWLIVLTLLSKSLFIYLFTCNTNNNILLLLLYKSYLGMASMIINNYVPLWIEQFAMHNVKVYLKSLIQIGNPLGKITSFIINHSFSWRTILYIESIILLSCAFILTCIKHLYFSSKVVILINTETNEEHIDKKEQKVINVFNSNDDNNYSLYMKLCFVLKIKLYIISLLLKVFIVGVQSTLQYWVPDYMLTTLHIEDNSSMKLLSNILIIISSPFGAFFCGLFISFSFIGYKQQNRSYILVICFYIVACICAFYIPYIETPELFVFAVIVFSFVSSACLHMLQGICMSIVDKDMKGIAFTLSNCLSFLVGSGMMPWVYGIQKEKDVEEGNYAMIFIMVVTVGFGLAVIPFFMYVSYTRTEDKKVNKSKDIEFVSWNIPDLSYIGDEEGEKRKSIISRKSKRSVTNNNPNNTGIVVNEFANAFAEPSIIETNNISQEINLENMNNKLLSDDEE